MTDKPAQVSIEAQIEACKDAALGEVAVTEREKATLRAAAATLRQAKTLAETQCKSCDYDEAEGYLFNHCDTCCRAIATTLWALTHD